ncbi:unnamed protein product [Porites lobata]|uniref:Uncharacterized protein n=1 Tax=Porites lobata TaxID=104759 RepID=A0ABN8MQK6_9CNID|nr:unnamed protein product [Porites lobata]
MGESSNVPGLCNEVLIPSPQQFGIGRSTATATQTHTAHLRLAPEECNVNDVAKLVKEYLNMDEDLDFWNVPAKKIYAITLSDYQKKKKKRIGAEGKTKDINQRESLWI